MRTNTNTQLFNGSQCNSSRLFYGKWPQRGEQQFRYLIYMNYRINDNSSDNTVSDSTGNTNKNKVLLCNYKLEVWSPSTSWSHQTHCRCAQWPNRNMKLKIIFSVYPIDELCAFTARRVIFHNKTRDSLCGCVCVCVRNSLCSFQWTKAETMMWLL